MLSGEVVLYQSLAWLPILLGGLEKTQTGIFEGIFYYDPKAANSIKSIKKQFANSILRRD